MKTRPLQKRGVTTLNETQVLMALKDGEPKNVKDVLDRLLISGSAVTGICTKLEKLGLIERCHASDDRRRVLLKIRPLGLNALEEAGL